MARSRLLFGLGNPGKQYAKTRHNVGFMVLDLFAENYQLHWQNGLFNSQELKIHGDEGNTFLIKPQTFMNLSGRTVGQYQRYLKVANTDILVVYDDLDLMIGDFKIKYHGGAGSHNGVTDVSNALRSFEFGRLKIGINTNNRKLSGKNFVLSQFTQNDLQQLNRRLPIFLKIIYDYVNGASLEQLMTKYNCSYD